MKSRILSLCLLIALFLTIACKNDEGDEVKVPANTVMYEGELFSISQTGIQDLGQTTDYPSHHCYNFILTDGKLTLYENSTLTGTQGNTFMTFLRLFSPGVDDFKTGTFEYINTDDLPSSEITALVKDQFFFDVGNFSRQIEKDDDDDPSSFPEYELAKTISGTVKVSGEATNYTIEFDLKMGNGKQLKGGYSGGFDLKTIK